MLDMTILIPTRERPQSAKRQHPLIDVEHYYCIDDDDPTINQYYDVLPRENIWVGPPNRLGGWLNHASQQLVDRHYMDIIGFVGDDVLPRTPNWAGMICEAMIPNGIVYCDDGWQGQNLPTAAFMDATMIAKAGYMVYPELTHLYIDNHWKAWGEALDSLVYLPDVYLEHMHPFAGKSDSDATYERANHPDMYTKDGEAYSRFITDELNKLVTRVRG